MINLVERLKQGFQQLKSSLIQTCPPELTACESSCDKLECSQEEWLTCEHRLLVAAELEQQLATDEGRDQGE